MAAGGETVDIPLERVVSRTHTDFFSKDWEQEVHHHRILPGEDDRDGAALTLDLKRFEGHTSLHVEAHEIGPSVEERANLQASVSVEGELLDHEREELVRTISSLLFQLSKLRKPDGS